MSFNAAVITVSDKGCRGEREDTSGPAVCEMLKSEGFEVARTAMLPDERELISAELIRCADELNIPLVITTGGTGFSRRDVTPEATLAVIERETRGIPEAMRLESLRVTPRGCLSRAVAGIRGGTLIVNLPGSEKAAKENLAAVLGSLKHGLQMLCSNGSADCAENASKSKPVPSLDMWLNEAKSEENADGIGMYLTHVGIVRSSSKAAVREGKTDAKPVGKMIFSYDESKVAEAIEKAKSMVGIYHVRVWLNDGELSVGETIMQVLIGGDIRPNVTAALDFLVGTLKSECVEEKEVFIQ